MSTIPYDTIVLYTIYLHPTTYYSIFNLPYDIFFIPISTYLYHNPTHNIKYPFTIHSCPHHGNQDISHSNVMALSECADDGDHSLLSSCCTDCNDMKPILLSTVKVSEHKQVPTNKRKKTHEPSQINKRLCNETSIISSLAPQDIPARRTLISTDRHHKMSSWTMVYWPQKSSSHTWCNHSKGNKIGSTTNWKAIQGWQNAQD